MIFTISFALLWLGAFPSGFTKYYSSCDLYIQTLWTINAFMQAIVTFVAIIYYIRTEKKELNNQGPKFGVHINSICIQN